MKKSNLMPTVVLGSICLVVALLLSFVNMVTGPIIKAAQDQAANAALLEVLPEGTDFTPLTIDETYPAAIVAGYKANGGFVFQSTVTGKSSGLIIMCGINADGKIVGTKVIAEQETDSYDANVFPAVEGTEGAYKGMALEGFEPYLVSGATLTSRAYGEAMKASLQADPDQSLTLEGHRRILAAVEKKDADGACELMRRHLDASYDRIKNKTSNVD